MTGYGLTASQNNVIFMSSFLSNTTVTEGTQCAVTDTDSKSSLQTETI